MFLSNRRKSLFLIGLVSIIFQACGPSQTTVNKPAAFDETKSEFPFSTKEPEVYQAVLVVTAGKNEKHWFIARNGTKWRIDFFKGDGLLMTQLRTDNLYKIDHLKKTYTVGHVNETPDLTGGSYFNELTARFFRGTEYREFDELGRDGGLRKFRVRSPDPAKDDVLIFIDEASGIMVREEFTVAANAGNASPMAYVYEIRGLKLATDDDTFTVPVGYKKVAKEETSLNHKTK